MEKRKGQKCPECGSTAVIPWVFGLPCPGTEDKLLSAEARGELMVGGCVMGPDSPKWHCNECRHDWGKWQ